MKTFKHYGKTTTKGVDVLLTLNIVCDLLFYTQLKNHRLILTKIGSKKPILDLSLMANKAVMHKNLKLSTKKYLDTNNIESYKNVIGQFDRVYFE